MLKKIQTIRCFINLIWVAAFITACTTEFKWSPPLLAHEVTNADSEFQMLWMKTNTFSLADNNETFQAVVKGQVIFAGSLNENRSPSLMSLDSLTGDLQWDIPMYPTGFATDSNVIYVGKGSGRLTAINIISGEVVWEAQLDNARNFSYLLADDSGLHVLSSTDNYYYVEKDSGTLEYSKKAPFRFFTEGNIAYFRSTGPAMIVKDLNGNRSWQTRLNDPFEMKPIFINDLILISTTQGGGPHGQIYVLERQTGKILWETSRGSIFSNVAVSNNVVYYLTSDAELKAANVYTGQILGTVSFTPEIAVADLVNRRFSVAAGGDIVVVHLGDSQQLFAFRFSP